jgi:putative DNA primase/helicase
VVEGRAKPAKVPDRKTNDPGSWMTYAQAVTTLAGHAGLAFLLGDGYAGIDIDGAPLGGVATEAIINSCAGAYVEPSLSGTGIHILGRSALLGCEVDFRQTPVKRTAWTSARFFVYLGTGKGDPNVDITKAIEMISPPITIRRSKRGVGFSAADDAFKNDDDYIIVLCETSDNGELFKALWAGDTRYHGNDHSQADLALLNILGYWTNYNAARMDRLFRRSGLYRDKWEVNTYRNATIQKAVNG